MNSNGSATTFPQNGGQATHQAAAGREDIGAPVARDSDDRAPRPTADRVSVVIPTLNEAANIAWVLERIPSYVDELILVDGRSIDGTVAVAKALRGDIVVVSEHRPGKGVALRAGFRAATGGIVVMLDADGSMDPVEMTRYIAVLESGFDLVKGSRFMAGGASSDITPMRRLGNRGLRWMVNVLYRANFSDLCYGYCVFRRHHLDALALAADGFEIETELILHAVAAGLRITEVPTLETPRRYGRSNLRTFQDGQRVLHTLLRERFDGGVGRTRRPVSVGHVDGGVVVPARTLADLERVVAQLATLPGIHK